MTEYTQQGQRKRGNIHSGTTLDALAELLGTVVLVEEVVSNLLQVSQMAVEKGGADGEEVRVARVVDLDDAPGVLASSDLAATDLNDILGSDDGERHEATELGILLDGVLVILLDVVGEVVDRDAVVLDVLHDELLGLGELGRSEGISTADNWDDVHARRQALHELDVQLAEAAIRAVSMGYREGCPKGMDRSWTYPWPVGVMK